MRNGDADALPATRELSEARERGASLDAPTRSIGDGWLSESNPVEIEAVRLDPLVMDRFEILGRLGHGGMGVVYLARDPKLDRNVALKVLNRRRSSRESDRLRREARALARLSHPNVVQVFEVGEVEQRVFIVMELVRGQTLREWQEGRSIAEILEVYRQAGQGLAAAHQAGLVHRDFKPTNVLLGDDGRVRVLDFGVARAGSSHEDISNPSPDTDASVEFSPEPSHTNADEIVGTPGYMAPEQLAGRTATPASDQFGFCAALYEALYGQRPYHGETLEQLRAAASAGPPEPPENAAVSGRVRAALLRGLAAESSRRWPGMASLLAALEPPPRRSVPWIVGGVAVLSGVALGWAAVPSETETSLCAGGQPQMAEVWGPTQRAAVAKSFRGAEVPYAERALQEVSETLDGYGARWLDRYLQICQATHVHGTQSPEDMDRAMACLSRRRRDLAAVVGVLSVADAGTVERARDMVDSLAGLETCADDEALGVGGPEDPRQREAAERLDAELAMVRAQAMAGHFAQALQGLERIESEAAALGHPALDARIAYQRGELHTERGEDEPALVALERAYFAAAEIGDGRLAQRSARALAFVLAVRRQRFSEAMQWAERALTEARRQGDELDEAVSLVTRAKVSSHSGDFAAARADFDRALPILERHHGPGHHDTLDAINGFGVLLAQQRQHRDSLPLFRRYLVAQLDRLGPMHPEVAIAYNNVGTAEQGLGQTSEALSSFRRALEIRERTFGPSHRMVGLTLGNIGVMHAMRGENDQARDAFERALAIAREAWGPDHRHVAAMHSNLAMLAENQDDMPAALEHHRQAMGVLVRSLGEEHPDTMRQRLRLAKVTRDNGAPDDSIAWAQPVITALEAAGQGQDALMAQAQIELAETELARSHAKAALEHARAALAIHERLRSSEYEIAVVQFIEARARWEVGGSRPLALSRAEDAREVLATQATTYREGLAKIDAWLAERRP